MHGILLTVFFKANTRKGHLSADERRKPEKITSARWSGMGPRDPVADYVAYVCVFLRNIIICTN